MNLSPESTTSGAATSIGAMLRRNAVQFAARPALRDDQGTQLTHAELYAEVTAKARALTALGINRGDRIAFALPPGSDAALIFLAAATCGIAVPLNPALSGKDFAFCLQDLRARMLIAWQECRFVASAAAQELRIPLLGVEALQGSEPCSPIEAAADGEDVALILHTSGTTSKPKKVPLTQRNLCESARNIAAALQLRPDDISLSLMPLFHIHGLACLLAALASGGSCICLGSQRVDRFGQWLEAWAPTWLSAAPTFLQAILDAARDMKLPPCSLRFVRSSSAPLPATVADGLEEILGVPVIEAYGMTEAAHQIASNPLPPQQRRSGSVGFAAGPRIAILDDAGVSSNAERVGEIVIQGASVTRGYEDNPAANACAFHGEWFRTGDQGYLDPNGYLFITGRLKELINRGGEKIAPREIDEMLLAHPAVRQAVAFPIPHGSLGEDIAAAVVLREEADEAQLRAFLLEHLPAFKVPSRICVVDDLPRGPSGKIQRIGMAERLAAALAVRYQSPASESEKLVAEAIGAVLGIELVGREDNFFALGGDSLRATQVMNRLRRVTTTDLPVCVLFRLPTPALLGNHLDEFIATREIDELARVLAQLSPEEQAQLLDQAPLPPT